MKDRKLTAIRAALFLTIGVNQLILAHGSDNNLFKLWGFLSAVAIFFYAVFIIQELIFELYKELENVRKTQKLAVEDEHGRPSPSNAEGPQDR